MSEHYITSFYLPVNCVVVENIHTPLPLLRVITGKLFCKGAQELRGSKKKNLCWEVYAYFLEQWHGFSGAWTA